MPVTINPANGLILAEYPLMSPSQVFEQINLADFASRELQTLDQKHKAMHKLAAKIEAHIEYWSTLITATMGKPITAARAEVKKSCLLLRHYADFAPQLLGPIDIASSYAKSCKLLKPLGTILTIMPWNYPLWQVIRVLAPNFMLGNSLVLAHAPNVHMLAVALAKLIDESDFPSNMLVAISHDYSLTQDIMNFAAIKGLAFTGSDKVGALLAGYAGAALKPSTLECGGSDPYLVMADANLALAAKKLVKSRLNNAGQVCISAKRIIVSDKIYHEFLELVRLELAAYKFAEPMLDSTILGPLARADIRQQVHAQVQASGAKVISGGFIPQGPGYFYPATLLSEVQPSMPVFAEEVFGPVICLTKALSYNHALQLANTNIYGLGAGIFTKDLALARDFSEQVNAGFCAINDVVSSDPCLPFGGIGRSGYGRELGAEGLAAFANIKVVVES